MAKSFLLSDSLYKYNESDKRNELKTYLFKVRPKKYKEIIQKLKDNNMNLLKMIIFMIINKILL